ncbi:hypothetical protein E2542_SST09416 [Spatholobus suberectus]|nr:hypothetical protein E2542_SST09416 [Spatholobus suberectus]
MARLSNDLILVAFFLATIIATISPTEGESLAQCAEHIGSQCGKQVINKLKGDDKTIISTDCCYKLLQMGYSCHAKLTLHIIQNSTEPKIANETEVLNKSEKIFRICDLRTKPESPKLLVKCSENLSPKCGEQVYNKLIHDKNITEHCCEKLVETGHWLEEILVEEDPNLEVEGSSWWIRGELCAWCQQNDIVRDVILCDKQVFLVERCDGFDEVLGLVEMVVKMHWVMVGLKRLA